MSRLWNIIPTKRAAQKASNWWQKSTHKLSSIFTIQKWKIKSDRTPLEKFHKAEMNFIYITNFISIQMKHAHFYFYAELSYFCLWCGSGFRIPGVLWVEFRWGRATQNTFISAHFYFIRENASGYTTCVCVLKLSTYVFYLSVLQIAIFCFSCCLGFFWTLENLTFCMVKSKILKKS